MMPSRNSRLAFSVTPICSSMRAHQPLIRVDIVAGDRVLDLGAVAEGIHVVQVVVQQGLGRLFVGVDEGALDLFLGQLVVVFAGLVDEAEQAAVLFLVAGVLLEAVAQGAQDIDRRDVALAALDQRRRDAVDDEARARRRSCPRP